MDAEPIFSAVSSTPKSFQKKIVPLLVIFLLLVVAGGALYWLLFQRERLLTNFFRLDETIPEEARVVEYDRVARTPPDTKITDVDPVRSDESLTKVLKGYFYTYNQATQTLELLNQFHSSSYLQQLAVNTSQLIGFYCWPETAPNSNGAIKTHEMEFFVYPDGRDLYMPGEKFIKLDLLSDFLNTERYVIIQLREAFNLRSQNQVQKLILVGC